MTISKESFRDELLSGVEKRGRFTGASRALMKELKVRLMDGNAWR